MLGGRVHQRPRGRKDGAMNDDEREGRQLRERQLLNQLADEDYCQREGLLDPSRKLPKCNAPPCCCGLPIHCPPADTHTHSCSTQHRQRGVNCVLNHTS